MLILWPDAINTDGLMFRLKHRTFNLDLFMIPIRNVVLNTRTAFILLSERIYT